MGAIGRAGPCLSVHKKRQRLTKVAMTGSIPVLRKQPENSRATTQKQKKNSVARILLSAFGYLTHLQLSGKLNVLSKWRQAEVYLKT